MTVDGVLAEPFHIAGGHVHRQLGTNGERRQHPLQPRVRLREHDPHFENYPGTLNSSISEFQVFKKKKHNLRYKTIQFRSFLIASVVRTRRLPKPQ